MTALSKIGGLARFHIDAPVRTVKGKYPLTTQSGRGFHPDGSVAA